MGSWDETCGLTSAPIFSGEECVMVVLDPVELSHFSVFESILGQTGSLVEIRLVRGVQFGTYNDYGWLNEVDEVDDYEHRSAVVFFHIRAWQWALRVFDQERMRDSEMRKHEFNVQNILNETNVKESDVERDFFRVCKIASLFRRDVLSSIRFRGHQEFDCTPDMRKEFIDLQNDINIEQRILREWDLGDAPESLTNP